MRFPVILLWITCVLFVGFGLGFVVMPLELADLITGDSPSVPNAVIDMRAVYGGVALGLGVFVGLCARRADWIRPGLIASLLVVASIGTARLVGIIADGSPNAFMLFFLATEVVSVGLLAVALRQVRTSAG